MSDLIRFFKFDHLPTGAPRETSAVIAGIAHAMNQSIPDGPQKELGMQKLLEAKDCFVRAVLP